VDQIKNNYEKYAEAVVRAVADYANFTYIPPIGGDYYVVQKGDSLWSIANKFGLTVTQIKELNNLTNNTIKVGQALKISTSEEEIIPEDYLIYKVQKGDSLWFIANKYNTTVQTLLKINNLDNNNLTINQQLLVPKSGNITNDTTYTVKNGDTLYSIASKNNISVDDLKNANNLTSNILNIGDVLIIPTSSTGEVNYIVQKGDNLYNIAKKYGTTINDIKDLNNLTSNILQIGQILKIPGSTNYNTYIVQKGDTLWQIANKYGTTVNKLMTINNLTNNNLDIGDTLLIPTN